MNNFEADSDRAVGCHEKPCVSCRRRKIRCCRNRPCTNCSRSKQLCTYENLEANGVPDPKISPSSDEDVRERLAKLENMMATILIRGNSERLSRPVAAPIAPTSFITTPIIFPPTSNIETRSTPPHGTGPMSYGSQRSQLLQHDTQCSSVVGQILFQDRFSAYYDADFWPFLIAEIDDLRDIFYPPTHDHIYPSWPSVPPYSTIRLPLMHPALVESNALCNYFFERVHPFVGIIHQSLFTRELDQYRRGNYPLPDSFEALLFSMHLLTVSSLHSSVVEKLFSAPKQEMLDRLQTSTQMALTNINYTRTEVIHGLGALLYYVTFLFQQNSHKDAVALLGVAANLGRNMGMHRDPSHFPFSPWVCNIRRKLWNHLCCLDGLAIQLYGAESCLPARSDSKPQQNSDDSDWPQANRFEKPGSAPKDQPGFRDPTFVLVHRAISDTVRQVAELEPTEYAKKEEIIRMSESSIGRKYLSEVNRTNPRQTIIVALLEVRFAALRLTIQYRQLSKIRARSEDPERHRTFIAAVELLETYEYHCKSFAVVNWEWVFETIIPCLAIAIVLTEIPHTSRSEDRERGQRQINEIFEKLSDPANPVSKTPMWHVLLQLRHNVENPNLTAKSDTTTSVVFPDDLMPDYRVPSDSIASEEFDRNFMFTHGNSTSRW